MVLVYRWVFSGLLFSMSHGYETNCKKYRPYLLMNPTKCCKDIDFLNEEALMKCGLLGTMVDNRIRVKREESESIVYIRGRTEEDIIEDKREECYKWKCVYDEMGFVDENTRIDRDALETYLLRHFVQDIWDPIIEHILTECVWTNRRVTLKYEPCKPKRISACIGAIIFQYCPKNRFNNTASCNMLRKYLWECILIRSLN